MLCPYPDCGQDIPPAAHVLYCSSCAQPSFLCPHCGTANRTFARRCRSCGKHINLADLLALPTDRFAQRELGRVQPIKLGEVRGLCPELTVYGGYLWGVSFYGDLYKLARTDTRLKTCGKLPGNGFIYPLFVDEDDTKGPLLYVNNTDRLYRFYLLTMRYEEVLALDNAGESFASGVVNFKEHYYFLLRKGERGETVVVKCKGTDEWEYPLTGLSLLDWLGNPLRRIGDSLWVFTKEKLLIFPKFARAAVTELAWTPWRIFLSAAGVWYSEKESSDRFGEKQTLTRVSFEEQKINAGSFRDLLPITDKIVINPADGHLAIVSAQTIRVLDFNLNVVGSSKPGTFDDIGTPDGLLLSPDILFWFEAAKQTVCGWPIKLENKVWQLSSFASPINFSGFFLNDSCLYGLAHEEIWRWDLLGS